jgi:hypothetical protein
MSTNAFRVPNERVVHSTDSVNDGDEFRSSRLCARLRSLTGAQVELAETRQQVLIDRQRFNSSAKQIRDHREKTGHLEAKLMDSFREHYTQIGAHLPRHLYLAYMDTEDSRNKLVAAEDSHTEMAQELELSELNLTEEEEDLYQRDIEQLLSDMAENSISRTTRTIASKKPRMDSIQPSNHVSYQVDLKAYHGLLRQFKLLRSGNLAMIQQISRSAMDCTRGEIDHAQFSAFARSCDDTIDRLIASEVKMQRSKARLASAESTALQQLRARSEPSSSGRFHHERSALFQRAESDRAGHTSTVIVPHMTRVEEWLLECLQKDSNNKMYYVLVLQAELGNSTGSLDFGDWAHSIIESWSTKEPRVAANRDHRSSEARFQAPDERVVAQSLASIGQHSHITSDHEFRYDYRPNTDYLYNMQTNSKIEVPAFSIEDCVSDYSQKAPHPERTESSDNLHVLHEGASNSTQPGVPRWTVTEPQNDCANESSNSTGQPSVEHQVPLRRDSAYNSDAGQQCQNVSVNETASLVQKNCASATKLSLPTSASDVPHSDPIVQQMTAEVTRYSPWEWSPDLRLHFRYRLTEDDEVIEADWSKLTTIDGASPTTPPTEFDEHFDQKWVI